MRWTFSLLPPFEWDLSARRRIQWAKPHHPPQSVYWCLFLGGLRWNQKRNQSMRCASFSPIILLACQGPLKLPNSMFIDYSTILNHPTKKLRLPLLLLRLFIPRWKTSPTAVVIDDEGHRFEWQLRGYNDRWIGGSWSCCCLFIIVSRQQQQKRLRRKALVLVLLSFKKQWTVW